MIALTHMSKRERQICDLFALGYRSCEVAAKLFISDKTVHAHKARIKAKFCITNSVEWMTLLRRIQQPTTENA